MRSYTVQLKQSEDLILTIPEEIVRKNNLKPGDEVRMKVQSDGSIKIEFLTEVIAIDIPNDLLLKLSLEAHQRKQTLNSYINDIIEERLEKEGL